MKTTTFKILNVKRKDGKVIEFTIARKFWGRGVSGGSLLNSSGLMCCLGHYSKACRIPQDTLLNEEYPSDLKEVPDEMNWIVDTSDGTALERWLGEINDNIESRDKDRESLIKEVFQEQGIKVNFI